jgi:hypothetical protein
MINLKRTYIPFSITGGVCYLSAFSENEILTKATDEKIAEKVGQFQEIGISKLVFADINPRTRGLEFFSSKVELNGINCIHYSIPDVPKKNSTMKEFISYSEHIENFYKKIGDSNFKYFFSTEENKRAILFLLACIIFKDETIELDEICSYLLPEGDIPSKTIVLQLTEWKKFAFSEKFLIYKTLTRDLGIKHNLAEPEVKNTVVGPGIEIPLNLQSLQEETKVTEKQDTDPKIPLNLEGFQEVEFTPESITEENPVALVEELLDFAENFDVEETEDLDWEDAFPDTGQKVESNFTLNDHLIFQKGESTVEVSEDSPIDVVPTEESYSHYMDDLLDTIKDLKSIPEEEDLSPANRETTGEETPAIATDPSVPFPDVLNLNTIKTELDTDPFAAISIQSKQQKENEMVTTESNLTPSDETLEVDIDPTVATYIDREIKDAITKEILEDDEDPRKKSMEKEKKKKNSKPLTIIVTAEKTDSIHPLDKSRKIDESNPDFKAIPLD